MALYDPASQFKLCVIRDHMMFINLNTSFNILIFSKSLIWSKIMSLILPTCLILLKYQITLCQKYIAVPTLECIELTELIYLPFCRTIHSND